MVRAFVCLSAILACLALATAPTAAQRLGEEWDWQVVEGWEWVRLTYPDEDPHSNYTRTDGVAARQMWECIADAGSGDEWEGLYTRWWGEIDYVAVRWSAGAGFVAVDVYTCFANARKLGYGRATADAASVTLVSDLPGGPYGNAERFLKVKWGERHYLVEKDRIAAFCEYAAGRERAKPEDDFSRDDAFLLKYSDSKRPVADVPVVPPEYARFVKRPIRATVTAVDRVRSPRHATERVTSVRLDAGSADGVGKGTVFKLWREEGPERVVVVAVGEHSSRAELTWYAREGEEPPEVRVGMHLSTQPERGE